MKTRSSTSVLLALTLACGAHAVGCSGSSGNPGGQAPLPEHTGGVVMKLSNTPADVLCVEIDTSDYRTSQVRIDVTPGGTETVQVAPLDPGTVWLSGQAFNQSCASLDYGYSADAGSTVTWVADSTPVDIIAGQYAQTDLPFHQLGGADVNVTFDTCDGGGGNFYYCGGDDGGFDGGPGYDATPPPYDAGPPPNEDACGDQGACAMVCPVGETLVEGVDGNGCLICTCESMDAGTAYPMRTRR